MATKSPQLTIKQLMAGFSVSDMTVYSWRQGSDSKTALPSHKDGNKVYFKPAEVKAWAKKHSLEFDEAKATASPDVVKSGPKVKAVVKKEKTKAQKIKSAMTPLPRPPVQPKRRAAQAAA